MNTFFDQWQAFWYRQMPPHTLALLRIAFALYLIAEALTYLPFVSTLFSEQALTFSSWAPHVPSSVRLFLEPPSAIVAWTIAGAYLLACLLLLVGYRMRSALMVLILFFLYYWQLSFFLFPSSYHRIYFVVLFILLLSGADKTFSLRMLREKGSVYAWEPVSIFAQRLLAVQITFTYLGVGLQKAWLPAWQDGRALSMSLAGRWGTSLGRYVINLGLPFSFYSAAVWGIKIGEVLLPIGLWLPRWRIAAVVAGASFHIGIAVLMSIWWFVALIPAYIVFWPPEAVYEFCRKIARGRIL